MDFGDLFWIILIGLPILGVLSVAAGLFFSVKKAKKEGVRIENIRAQLILPTTNYHQMENFLLAKEPYLSPELIQQLINRIQELKTDAQIGEDFDARLRVSSKEEELEEPIDFGKTLIERQK